LAVSTQWYENFFYGIANDLWDKCASPEMTTAEVDFLVGGLECKAGSRVLDIPCGNGRHCRELAKRGYRMTGFDISSEYSEAAKKSSTDVE